MVIEQVVKERMDWRTAQGHLEEIIDHVQQPGEQVVITRDGEPAAVLVGADAFAAATAALGRRVTERGT